MEKRYIDTIIYFKKEVDRTSRNYGKTFFSVNGDATSENVASNILAFFLDNKEEHGFGNLWIESLLELISDKFDENIVKENIVKENEDICVDREVSTDGGGRIDLLIITKEYKICIENKIFATLNNNLKCLVNNQKARNFSIYSLSKKLLDLSEAQTSQSSQ